MKSAMRFAASFLVVMALISAPRRAVADEYDDSQSHPLRVVGYLVHPVGVVLEWLTARPFHFLVSGTKELEHLSGHKNHPPLFSDPQPAYEFGVVKRAAMREATAPKMAVPQEPVAERVTVKEITVEKAVLKEVPKIVEVERIIFPDIAFRFNSSELTDLGKGRVYLAAQRLKEKSDVVVVIEGHADYIGGENYNQQLGLRRADKVMKELEQLGVEPNRMSVASFGETKPAIDQQTDWARALNRRVEFRVATP